MKQHFFKNFEMDFEAQRLLWYCPAGGSDFAEVAATTEKIKDGSYEAWYQEWTTFAKRLVQRADNFQVAQVRGNAYLRASRYYQAAEFFLHPNDPRKLTAYAHSVALFYRGLKEKNIVYEEHLITFHAIQLRTIYFPTQQESKGTIYLCGGFDALLEELYFTSGKFLNENGYDVILYEGPGQSHAIRYYKQPFELNWHFVAQAVQKYYSTIFTLHPLKIGIGISLGGLLMSRASSLDNELFDKIILYDYFPSMLDSFKKSIPKPLHRYLVTGLPAVLEKMVSSYIAHQKFLNWQVEHAKWVFGADSLNELLKICANFSETIAYQNLYTDCLILVAKNDNYYDSSLAQNFFTKIPEKNKKMIVFDKVKFSTDLHCQNGSGYDANDQIIDWLH